MMDKEQVHQEMQKLANNLAELSVEILKIEKCFGAKVVVEITNIMGMCNVSLNVKTSQPGQIPGEAFGEKKSEDESKADGEEPPAEGENPDVIIGEEPPADADTAAPPPVDVDAILKDILGKRPQ